MALFSLYMIYAGGVASMGMGDPFQRPSPPRLVPWMAIPTPMLATPDARHGGSVVDEVFAEHAAEAKAVARRRA